jgi:hypothetical protein
MPTPVLPLEYAAATPVLDPGARRAFGELLWLSVLSGLCVGVCFLSLTEALLAALLHVTIFAVTIILAVRAGMSVAGLGDGGGAHRTRMLLDGLAGLGLVGIGISPIVYYIGQGEYWSVIETYGVAALGLSYALLAATTYRHVLLYRVLAEVCRSANHPSLATRLIRLGWGKAIYEGLWLSCCALALLLLSAGSTMSGAKSDFQDAAMWCAFAALFGAMGFAGIWVWMIVVHAVLLAGTRRG